MFNLYADYVPPVSDLHLTNRGLPLFLICVRTKSISGPGNSICIRSASMFDVSIANPNSTLVLRASFYFVTPKTPQSCRTTPISLARCLSDTDTTLHAQLSKWRLIPPTRSTNLYIYPFTPGLTSRLPPRVLALLGQLTGKVFFGQP